MIPRMAQSCSFGCSASTVSSTGVSGSSPANSTHRRLHAPVTSAARCEDLGDGTGVSRDLSGCWTEGLLSPETGHWRVEVGPFQWKQIGQQAQRRCRRSGGVAFRSCVWIFRLLDSHLDLRSNRGSRCRCWSLSTSSGSVSAARPLGLCRPAGPHETVEDNLWNRTEVIRWQAPVSRSPQVAVSS